MPAGTPLNRTWICMLIDGTPVIDWGNGKVQDIYTGEFRPYREGEFSHVATDRDLDQLKRAGRVCEYTGKLVYLNALPEPERRVLD
ncbi:MAG: hypothetical protein HYZ26_01340 [Chloroflexi bacterium]|nr:hypothetical protein [Chloroflexota bacterium]